MRWLFAALPWEVLGSRLVMLSLTYPGESTRWVGDGRVWDGHRRAFLERWRRRWGSPMGVWVKEFQRSGRPHLHLYMAVPDAVAEEDFEGLRERTMLRHRLEKLHGQYEGRRRLPAIGGEYGGEFAMWLRTAWSEVVGTQGVLQAHHVRGVDVAVAFWTDEIARTKDRIAVAGYLAGESAKLAQKRPPPGFHGVGRYYGHFGGHQGFAPESSVMVLDRAVAHHVERVLARWVRVKMITRRRKFALVGAGAFDERRWGDGVTALGVRGENVARLLRWATAAAARDTSRWSRRGYGGEAPDEITRGVGRYWASEMPPEDRSCWNEGGWCEPDGWGDTSADWGEIAADCGCRPGEKCPHCDDLLAESALAGWPAVAGDDGQCEPDGWGDVQANCRCWPGQTCRACVDADAWWGVGA